MKTARQTIEKAFVTAHLLTGNIRTAENITIDAIGNWNPREEAPEVLFGNVLKIAARTPSIASEEGQVSEELRRVLRLNPSQRRCFVLRILVGLSAETCAEMLEISAHRVDCNTRAALQTFRSPG